MRQRGHPALFPVYPLVGQHAFGPHQRHPGLFQDGGGQARHHSRGLRDFLRAQRSREHDENESGREGTAASAEHRQRYAELPPGRRNPHQAGRDQHTDQRGEVHERGHGHIQHRLRQNPGGAGRHPAENQRGGHRRRHQAGRHRKNVRRVPADRRNEQPQHRGNGPRHHHHAEPASTDGEPLGGGKRVRERLGLPLRRSPAGGEMGQGRRLRSGVPAVHRGTETVRAKIHRAGRPHPRGGRHAREPDRVQEPPETHEGPDRHCGQRGRMHRPLLAAKIRRHFPRPHDALQGRHRGHAGTEIRKGQPQYVDADGLPDRQRHFRHAGNLPDGRIRRLPDETHRPGQSGRDHHPLPAQRKAHVRRGKRRGAGRNPSAVSLRH